MTGILRSRTITSSFGMQGADWMGRRGRDLENGLPGEVRHELGPEGKQTGTCQDKSKSFDARDSTVLGAEG